MNQAAEVETGLQSLHRLKSLASRKDPSFHRLLRDETRRAENCHQVLLLASLGRKARAAGFHPKLKSIRIAVLGGYTPHPLVELIGHLLSTGPAALDAEFLVGDYDNYTSEIVDESSRLYEFRPDVIFLLPSHQRCRYTGHLHDSAERQRSEALRVAQDILDLCARAGSSTGAAVILTNFPLPGNLDPGPYRTRTLGSDFTFRKVVNLELGVRAPSSVHICDVEFLSARRGTAQAWDARAWFENKQPYGRELLLDVAREAAHLIETLRQDSKKVAVLDLDNTLWGGAIGEDGLEGIEIGDTSPRGEAFKAFQQYLLSLTHRGVLLAVCSKNDHERAVEAFEKHPEMVLRMKDISAFLSNWQPKSENLRQIASDLNLGLDSMVFIDDNPAEIEIVNQFVPEVETILLGDDPAEYCTRVQNARFFEPKFITPEDLERVGQYRQEAQRREILSTVTDMASYLESLQMEAAISEFRAADLARVVQLINKSNQFNLTTRRRTESEAQAIMAHPSYCSFSVRLSDRFGDHGLISVVIAELSGGEMTIDTWLMSCRVLKRQVEEEVLNEIVRLARLWNCSSVRGIYIPTSKNGMVKDLYPNLGFILQSRNADCLEFTLDPRSYQTRPTKIRVATRSYDAN